MTSSRPVNMASTVLAALTAEIHDGKLLPGDALDETQLSERFGVSRTPVREALLHLSAQGLVTIVPRSGIYVARLSFLELFAMFELLAELEGVCAKLAAQRMTHDEVDELKAAYEAAAVPFAARDPAGYEIANRRFHAVLYAGCHNEFLKSEIEFIRKRTYVYRKSVFSRRARILVSYHDHGRVLKAIEDGDGELAQKHMLAHIVIGGHEFTEHLAKSSAVPLAKPTLGPTVG